MEVLRADDDVMRRRDKGSLVVKIFRLQEASAEDVGERLSDNLPTFASLSVDANSNQIMVIGDVALCQHLQNIIDELDRNHVEVQTQTFRLAYADAEEISQNILDLFDIEATGTSRTQQQRRTPQRRGQQPNRPTSTPGTEVELRVTVNVQQNSVTVSSEPQTIADIARLIDEEWDLPRSPGTSKIYQLAYTDPIKVAQKINSLLGQGSGTSGRARQAGQRQGGAGGAGVDQILSGIYRIEAFEDTNQLFVFCKTEQSLDFLDEFIQEVDQPTDIGLPFIIELYHANAVELAEELNALLSEPGSQATIPRPEEGLFGRIGEEGTSGGSPGQGQGGGAAAGTISFPWQRGGGPQAEERAPESSLIGSIRIVPVARQNALAILCPPSQRQAMEDVISFFDRPGRQVMVSAIIAEVELNDDLAFGLRFSNDDSILSGGNPDNRVGGVTDFMGNQDNPLNSLFDSSSLDVNTTVFFALQALAQKTNVRIIQEPIVFTADNQEAIFFDGQDIPFITNTTINSQGNPTDSFEYREVGVTLNVRPRITAQRDVDLEVNLELSSVVPGVLLFGGAIVDRRETSTHVIVKNNQTIVISGILREEESKIKRGWPIIGDIPLIGDIFASHENSTKTTELIAFITPRVVDNPSENDTNFQQKYRERLQDLNRPVGDQAADRKADPDYLRRRIEVQSSGQESTGDYSIEDFERWKAEQEAEAAERQRQRQLEGVLDSVDESDDDV
jgi:general secretion pathway protein D